MLFRSDHKPLSLSQGSPNNNPPQPLPKQPLQHKEMEGDSQETCYDFSPLYAYGITNDSYRTLGLLTPLCLLFIPLLLDGHRLLCTSTYSAMTCTLCTCDPSLCRCLVSPHVYKRSTLRRRNSKRVLFCTNTSRRRTCALFL